MYLFTNIVIFESFLHYFFSTHITMKLIYADELFSLSFYILENTVKSSDKLFSAFVCLFVSLFKTQIYFWVILFYFQLLNFLNCFFNISPLQ